MVENLDCKAQKTNGICVNVCRGCVEQIAIFEILRFFLVDSDSAVEGKGREAGAKATLQRRCTQRVSPADRPTHGHSLHIYGPASKVKNDGQFGNLTGNRSLFQRGPALSVILW